MSTTPALCPLTVATRGAASKSRKVFPPLAPRPKPPVRMLNATRFTVFTFGWQVAPPRDALVIVVKGTYDMTPFGPAQLAAEQLPPMGDMRSDETETSSVRYPSHFAVFKPRADIVLVGHAYLAKDTEITNASMQVGSLRRSIVAIGDRKWEAGGVQSKPAGSDRIPLRWERALGGSQSPHNPVGRGYKTGVLLPNLERPEAMIRKPSDDPAPACCSPVAPEWAERQRKLGTFDKKWLQKRWPYMPEDLDWSYYNAAPSEQQVPYLQGDEPFSFTGVQPDGGTLTGSLPGIRPCVFAQESPSAGGGFFQVAMRLDTAWFDTDDRKLVLVWRGLLHTRDAASSDIASLFVMSAARDIEPEQAQERFWSEALKDKLVAAEAANEEVAAPEPPPAPVASREVVMAAIAQGISLAGKDLTGVQLAGIDLHEADLSGAVLQGADLTGALLDRAHLESANLAGVKAEGASLCGAFLSQADLHAAHLVGANLASADLSGADLSEAQCTRARMTDCRGAESILVKANLDEAKLDRADFTGANWIGASLRQASLEGAKLDRIKLYEAKGARARFDQAQMASARMEDGSFPEASFVQINAPESQWSNADLTGCSLLRAHLERANFTAANLERAVLNKTHAAGASFRGAKLREAQLLKANLMQASFEGADLSSAQLGGANLYEAETWKAKLDGADLRLANVTGSKLAK